MAFAYLCFLGLNKYPEYVSFRINFIKGCDDKYVIL